MKAVRRGAVLVVFWFLAWGELSLANLLTGAAAAAVLLAVFPPRRSTTEWVPPHFGQTMVSLRMS